MKSEARSDFLAAFDGTNSRTPVWFMRQAGRYLPAYRKVRSKNTMKQICSDPEIISDLTYSAIRDLGVDAGIIFFDITLPLEAMGFNVEFVNGVGPVVRIRDDFQEIQPYRSTLDSFPLSEGIRKFLSMHPEVPLIGFAGGPLTLASYLVAGKSDRDLIITRKKLFEDRNECRKILSTLMEAVITFSKKQIAAGVDVIQIFDSWASSLSTDEFLRYVQDYVKPLFSELSSQTRTIYFTAHSSRVLEAISDLDVDFISIDSHISPSEAARRLANTKGIQGNLDPLVASSSISETIRQTKNILEDSRKVEKFIFNLSHGVLPTTPPENLIKVVEEVHSFER